MLFHCEMCPNRHLSGRLTCFCLAQEQQAEAAIAMAPDRAANGDLPVPKDARAAVKPHRTKGHSHDQSQQG
jgi:hypothetical protein